MNRIEEKNRKIQVLENFPLFFLFSSSSLLHIVQEARVYIYIYIFVFYKSKMSIYWVLEEEHAKTALFLAYFKNKK